MRSGFAEKVLPALNWGTCWVNSPPIARNLGEANYDAITIRGGQGDRLWWMVRLLESSAIRLQPTPAVKHPTCVGAVEIRVPRSRA